MKQVDINRYTKAKETLEDFRCLIPRYIQCKTNPTTLDMFLSRNRNPLFDLTTTKFWSTGLKSEKAKTTTGKIVRDHYIPRKIATGVIFEFLIKNPKMSVEEFIVLCLKYGSTIDLTHEEHELITNKAKNSGKCNYELYESVGIKVKGLEDLTKDVKIF